MIAIAIDRLDARRHTFGILLEHLVAALRDEAPDLEVVLVRRRGAEGVRVDGIRELFIPAVLSRNVGYARLAPLWFRSRGVRLVHYPFLYTPATWVGGPDRRVVTVHGASRAALGDELVTRFSPSQLERTRRRLRAYDRVITVSESARREIVEHYRVEPERVRVIYNGVGERFRPGSDDPRVLANYGIEKPYILVVSTIKPKKNVTAALHAFADLVERRPDLPHRLVFVGDKADGYTELDDAIRTRGLAGRVVQTGWAQNDEIPSFYAGADLLVFPSFHEGFGLPTIEAMASGCPVVASAVYSIPEVGGDAILTFDPHDRDAIRCQIERVLSESGLRERLVASGLARAERFGWKAAARQTAEVYREVLGSTR